MYASIPTISYLDSSRTREISKEALNEFESLVASATAEVSPSIDLKELQRTMNRTLSSAATAVPSPLQLTSDLSKSIKGSHEKLLSRASSKRRLYGGCYGYGSGAKTVSAKSLQRQVDLSRAVNEKLKRNNVELKKEWRAVKKRREKQKQQNVFLETDGGWDFSAVDTIRENFNNNNKSKNEVSKRGGANLGGFESGSSQTALLRRMIARREKELAELNAKLYDCQCDTNFANSSESKSGENEREYKITGSCKTKAELQLKTTEKGNITEKDERCNAELDEIRLALQQQRISELEEQLNTFSKIKTSRRVKEDGVAFVNQEVKSLFSALVHKLKQDEQYREEARSLFALEYV